MEEAGPAEAETGDGLCARGGCQVVGGGRGKERLHPLLTVVTTAEVSVFDGQLCVLVGYFD